MAQPVAAGAFEVPGARGGRGNAMADLPAFCRVAATLTPSSDSDIKIEVWLPSANWNGKFQAVGNGAWSGAIGYPAMADALRRGYATSSTDTGHVGGSARLRARPSGEADRLRVSLRARDDGQGQGDRQRVLRQRARSTRYWNGCSAGGRQALKEAQMFPGDFDGIIAGAPGLDWSGRSAQAVKVAQALQKEEARLTPAKQQVLHAAVLQACDALDGVKDGLIENPVACKFDPKALECKAGDGPDVPDAGAGRHGAADLCAAVSREARTRRPGVRQRTRAGPTWAGRPRPARPASITTASWCSRIPPGTIDKFNLGHDIAAHRRRCERGAQRAAIRTSSRSSIAAASCCSITAGPIRRSRR